VCVCALGSKLISLHYISQEKKPVALVVFQQVLSMYYRYYLCIIHVLEVLSMYYRYYLCIKGIINVLEVLSMYYRYYLCIRGIIYVLSMY